MVYFPEAADAASLLGRPARDLALLVRGGPADGQTLTIRTRKAAVGAHARCDVPVGTGPDVGLLILRGAAHTIVRRLAGTSSINGNAFDDTLLRSGDRLALADVELEVVPAGVAPAATESRPRKQKAKKKVAQRRVRPMRLDALRNKLRTLQARVRRLEASQDAVPTASQPMRAELVRLEEEIKLREMQLHERQQALAAAELDLQRRGAALAASQAELATRLSALEHEWVAQQHQSERNADELAQKQEEVQAQRAFWQAEIVEERHQLEQRAHRLDAQSQTLDALREQTELKQKQLDERQELWNQERAAWQADLERIDNDRATVTRELGDELDALGMAQDKLVEERARWQREQTAADQAMREREAQLEAQLQAFEQQILEHQAQQKPWRDAAAHSEPPALPANHTAAHNTRSEFASEVVLSEGEPEASVEVAGEEEDAPPLVDDEQPMAALVADETEAAEPAAFTQVVDEPAEVAQIAAPAVPEPLSAVTLTTAEMLARLGKLPDYFRDEAPGAEERAPTPEPVFAQPAVPHGDHEEESIDDYMARLMQRVSNQVQGGAGPISAPAIHRPEVAPKPAPPRAQPVDNKPIRDLSEIARRPSPELNTDLGSMRDVANFSARQAIDNHARRTIGQATYSYAFRMVFSLIVSGVLLWLSFTHAAYYFYGALCGLGFTGFWGFRYAVVARRMLKSQAVDVRTQHVLDRVAGNPNAVPLADVPVDAPALAPAE